MLSTPELYDTSKEWWYSHKTHLQDWAFQAEAILLFLSEMLPFCCCCCISWSDYFCRCSSSKYLPWLSQLLKSSVIIIKDWMGKGSYFFFFWSVRILTGIHGIWSLQEMGSWTFKDSSLPAFVPPTSSCHVTRRQISTFIPLKLASVEGSKLTHENLGIWLTAIHSSPSSSCS